MWSPNGVNLHIQSRIPSDLPPSTSSETASAVTVPINSTVTTWLPRHLRSQLVHQSVLCCTQVKDVLEMKRFGYLLTALLLQSLLHESGCGSVGSSVVHSRKRRYVVFPEGSTLTAAACISPTVLSGTGDIFTSGLAWALSYDLPNETIHTRDNRLDFPSAVKRHKRDLFVRMEKLMDSAGMDGRYCILKAVCETAQKLLPRQGILEEILRLIFTYPPEKNEEHNFSISKHYAKAHQAGESKENCNYLYPCPISLLQLGLGFGKYQTT